VLAKDDIAIAVNATQFHSTPKRNSTVSRYTTERRACRVR
jgi:hypothetical protein